jgi:hypothetical protein
MTSKSPKTGRKVEEQRVTRGSKKATNFVRRAGKMAFPPMFVGTVLLITVALVGFFVPFALVGVLTGSHMAGVVAGGLGELWVLSHVL